MIDVTFITSNKTKLAHARYLCRYYQVNILYYKKLFYGVGYKEPRIYDRKQLLADSFSDAVARWRKNVSGSDDRLFFIEDTSVKIDALSNDEKEVPGVDVKYWMQDINFERLDFEIKSRGNNRRCSVTSHLILFLTEELRKKLGINDDFKVFESTAYGSVTEKEYVFETQLLFPWLDNKTFNKWFVPDGCSKPVSMLDISDADAGDFRKGAFEQMLLFLEENGIVKNKIIIEKQLHLQFNDNFLVCGRTCAGKTTIGNYLAVNYGYYHLEASEFMTHKLLETHGSKSGIDKHLFASKMLKYDPLIVVNRLIEYMHEHEIYDKYVITGFRTEDEVNTFINSFQSNRTRVIFIDSSFEERYWRWKRRHREADIYTETRFKEIDSVQDEMGIGKISCMSKVSQIDNHLTGLSHFFNNFCHKYLRDSLPEPISLETRELQSTKISLEKAILLSLAMEYQKDDSKLFTTTEIAHLINQYFKDIKRSKNNVSRYFNQSYYVYYEVHFNSRKNQYKLSPIGYSEALLTFRNLHMEQEK